MKTLAYDDHDRPRRCPTCDELVFRWYDPSYALGIYGEDLGTPVHLHVTDLGVAMHYYDDGLVPPTDEDYSHADPRGPELRAGDDYEVAA